MSDSSGSGISYHHGDDSDGEGSVAASHASNMPDTPNSKKRARPIQIQGKAWIYHGIITVDAALLHTASENDDDGPFSSLKPCSWAVGLGSLDKHLSAIGAQN